MNLSIIERLLFDDDAVSLDWLAEIHEAIGQPISYATTLELEALVSIRYLSDTKTKDGYSRLANYLLSKNTLLDKSLKLFELDAEAGRQTWYQRLRHAECIAVTGDMEGAYQKIEEIYAVEPEAVNGYAAIAWHLRNKRNRLQSPWALAKRDLDTDRLSPGYMLNVAELAMDEELPDEAANLINKAYELNLLITDGHARCGWSYYWPKGQYQKVTAWIEKDAAGRLSPEWRMRLAQAYAAAGNFDKAVSKVENEYADDPTLTDWYSRLGNYLLSKNTLLEKALWLFEQDAKASRQTWYQQLRHAECMAVIGDMDGAYQKIEAVYSHEPEAVNGYAAIAWRLRNKRNRLQSPWTLAKHDLDTDRLSPGYMLNVAELAMAEELPDEAAKLIKKAYELNLLLTDGHARCGWSCFWPKGQRRKVVEWMEKDADSARLSPKWRLRLAQGHAAAGDFDKAISKVKTEYADNPMLSDGYARCAWQYYWPKQQFKDLIDGMEIDKKLGRLSATWRLKLAEAYAASGNFETALKEVERGYADNSLLTDGYARCAWQYYWPKWPCGDYSPLFIWMEKDLNNGRMSPRWILNLSQVYAAKGNYVKAKNLLSSI
jgi:hypothetical protein